MSDVITNWMHPLLVCCLLACILIHQLHILLILRFPSHSCPIATVFWHLKPYINTPNSTLIIISTLLYLSLLRSLLY